MGNILEVRGLRKRYGAFALDDVTFDVPSGYIMGFIGPNGAGKTTTLKLILGIIQGEDGTEIDIYESVYYNNRLPCMRNKVSGCLH